MRRDASSSVVSRRSSPAASQGRPSPQTPREPRRLPGGGRLASSSSPPKIGLHRGGGLLRRAVCLGKQVAGNKTRTGQSQAARETRKAIMEEIVGSVTETKEQHLRRHEGGMRSCPRCHYYKFGHRWLKAHGHVKGASQAGPRKVVVWLAERPVRWGGAWGLGCQMCADVAARTVAGSPAESQGDASRRRLGTAWARFEVRGSSLQAEHIRQHQDYDVHKLAVLAWLRPDEPVQLKLQASLSDDQLLSGSVPQPEDWLRAWRAARTPQSWKAAAETLKTEHFIRKTRDRSVGSRPLESMSRIIREAVRIRKRRAVRQSPAITLCFDDRAGYKLVRFRCRVRKNPAASQEDALPPLPSSKHAAAEGYLGCYQCLRGSTLEDFADDYAERACREIIALLKRFCSPLGDSLDTDLYEHILAHVRVVVVDGALQKVAVLLREFMPNLILVMRDPSHMIRIACKEPLVRTGRFEEQHARLFTARHALLKDIQFSDHLQARLEACQKVVLRQHGAQGGGVKHVMRHFSLAAQRFESWTGPRRAYACCLHAVALLLADIAGDSRRTPAERRRAETCLDAMKPQDLLEVGLSGDFGEICMRSSL